MNQRDYLKKKAVKSKSKSLFKAYKAKRNSINKLIKSAKSNYCKREIDHNKNNPKEMWKQINQVISGKGRCSISDLISSPEAHRTLPYPSQRTCHQFVQTGDDWTNNQIPNTKISWRSPFRAFSLGWF